MTYNKYLIAILLAGIAIMALIAWFDSTELMFDAKEADDQLKIEKQGRINYISSITQPEITIRQDGSITYTIPTRSETFGDKVWKYHFNADGDYLADRREEIAVDTVDLYLFPSYNQPPLKTLMVSYPIPIPLQ